MKNIIILLAALFVAAGCQTTAYFDNNEYASLVRMEVFAQYANETCDQPQVAVRYLSQLEFESNVFATYTEFRPKNEETAELANIIRENIEEMEARYAVGVPSTLYCQQKTSFLIDAIQTGLTAVQSKVRQ